MRLVLKHVKKYIFNGFLAITPLALALFVLNFIYVGIDRKFSDVIGNIIGFTIPGLGLILLLSLLYLLGLVVNNVAGRQIMSWIERLTGRIPLVGTTYQVGKQLSSTLSLPERQMFKRAVLVDFLTPGIWTIGFVTGSVIDKRNQNERFLKIYVPTPPNPTSGTMLLVRESQTRDPGWTIDEAMRTVISAGIIGPEELR